MGETIPSRAVMRAVPFSTSVSQPHQALAETLEVTSTHSCPPAVQVRTAMVSAEAGEPITNTLAARAPASTNTVKSTASTTRFQLRRFTFFR